MKACSKCGKTKPLDEFHRQASKKDGAKAMCKGCGCAAARKFYYANREHFLGYAKEYMKDPANRARSERLKRERHIKDPRRRILHHAKIRARRFGLSFDLVITDIVIPKHCPALGIQLLAGSGKRQKDCSPTLDRIVPNAGYVRGNVAVISWRANRLKSDATVEELCAIVRYCESAVTFAERAP